jgi:hypothetical protein
MKNKYNLDLIQQSPLNVELRRRALMKITTTINIKNKASEITSSMTSIKSSREYGN